MMRGEGFPLFIIYLDRSSGYRLLRRGRRDRGSVRVWRGGGDLLEIGTWESESGGQEAGGVEEIFRR